MRVSTILNLIVAMATMMKQIDGYGALDCGHSGLSSSAEKILTVINNLT